MPPDECGGSSCSNRTIHRAARSGGAIPNPTVKGRDGVDNRRYLAPVTGGVDTHLDVNVAAALDGIGGLLGVEQFPTSPAGNRAAGVAEDLGSDRQGRGGGHRLVWGPLARYLRRAGVAVVEVDRPNRQERRRKGKTDAIDAIEAARAAQGERQLGRPRPRRQRGSHPGPGGRETLGEVHQDQEAQPDPPSRLHRPEEIRQCLQGLTSGWWPSRRRLCVPRAGEPVVYATKTALRALGRRVLALDRRDRRDRSAAHPAAQGGPEDLLSLYGVGIDSAAALLVTAGDNPDRLRSEAAWAQLCGVAPIEASSGKVTRLRLNRGGDRQANAALWHIVITRLSSDPRTRAYVERRAKKADQERDHPGPQALRRPRDLLPPSSLNPQAGGRSDPHNRLTPPGLS